MPATKVLRALVAEQEKFYNLARHQCLVIGQAQATQEQRCIFMGQSAAFNAVGSVIDEGDFDGLVPLQEISTDGEQIGDLPSGRPAADKAGSAGGSQ